ncbi:TetR/AcrR family transcriptional regulator [Actinotalea solisilvae]|uniref:TetR/AcrR family transcriptional regulator n=1 Tax=Actinotalea solisilvae TaxID=2072922 RepID=UPI0018F1977C|nr:TetR/AcrR family transcriptional regulator [Actinotalea solisilvae]
MPAGPDAAVTTDRAPRPLRADAARNLDALLEAAKVAFAAAGVDVPMREIAARAGVGVGTLYRHFPKRSDLIQAVFRREVDACADAGATLAAQHEPLEALTRWLLRFTDFVATKRGLGAALHSGDPAYDALPAYFTGRLGPTLRGLLDAAAAAGEVRSDVDPEELLIAVSRLCMVTPDDAGSQQGHRMVRLLVDGLRFGATRAP